MEVAVLTPMEVPMRLTKIGHYIPKLAVALLDHNEHSKDYKFNIKGVAIGNPLLRLDRDVPSTYDFFWSHGMRFYYLQRVLRLLLLLLICHLYWCVPYYRIAFNQFFKNNYYPCTEVLLFTKSTEVAAAVVDLSPLLVCSILLNSIQPVLSGVAVGAGWQSTVAYVNITCYYLIGIPIGVVLGYVLQLQVKEA